MRRAATLLRHGAQLCQKLPVDLGQALPTAVRSAGEPCTSTAATTLWTRIFDRQRRPFSAGAASAAGELLIDDSAVKRLVELQAKNQEGKPIVLRIEVQGGGCSGFQYKFALDSSINADDRVFEKGGARVVVDPVSLGLLKGARIQFEDSLMRSAFIIGSNPQSESSCGCGSSFVAKMS